MKKAVFFIVSVLLLHAAAHPQTSAVQKLSGDVQKDLAVMLKPGVHVADILGRRQLTTREYQLSAKVMKAVQKNQAWFTDTMHGLPAEQLSPAFEKLGLTNEEYNEYLHLSTQSNQLVAYAKDTLEITRLGDIISFRGQNHLRPLDSVQIDVARKVVLYRSYRLSYEGVAGKDGDAGNPEMTISSGYKFSFNEEPDVSDTAALRDFHRINMTSMQLMLGQVDNTGKTMLFFMAMEYEAGKTLAVTIPILFE